MNSGAALAAIDIGTNSIHLVVARLVDGDRFETLTTEREMVRLGSGGGDMKLLTPEALRRGLSCLTRMKGIADGFDAAPPARSHAWTFYVKAPGGFVVEVLC